eukprot:m.179800 g.179800  ORF g.179800 m.179800 type:complete len:225 (+) comp31989_c3_seq4:181-855(+)
MHPMNVLASTASYIAMLFTLYAISTTYMSKFKLSNPAFGETSHYRAGLWRKGYDSEFESSSEWYCNDGLHHEDFCSSIKAARAFSVMTVILTLVAGVLSSFSEHVVGVRSRYFGKKFAMVPPLVAAFFAMVSFSIWIGSVVPKLEADLEKRFVLVESSVGLSLGLLIGAWLFCMVAAVLTFFIPNASATRSLGSNKVAPLLATPLTSDHSSKTDDIDDNDSDEN